MTESPLVWYSANDSWLWRFRFSEFQIQWVDVNISISLIIVSWVMVSLLTKTMYFENFVTLMDILNTNEPYTFMKGKQVWKLRRSDGERLRWERGREFGHSSVFCHFKAKAVVFFHMVQDCADRLGFWFGDKYNSQKQKWQGLEPSSALFAVGLNKWNGHKVCSQNHHWCEDGGENEMLVVLYSICVVISVYFLRV